MAKKNAEKNIYENWSTPQGLFDELDKRYHFEVDVCASKDNAKCPKFFTKEQDGLKQKWEGICWCNPPYNEQIGLWIEKGWKSAFMGACVVCLVPVKTHADWWRECAKRGKIKHLRRQPEFANYVDLVPYRSAVVTFYPEPPHYGIFPDYDLKCEVNVWGLDRLSTMAPWLLPQLTDDIVETITKWNSPKPRYK